MNPLDEFLEEKRASYQPTLPGMGASVGDLARSAGRSFAQKLPGAAASAASSAAIAGGVTAGGIAAQKIYDAITKRRDFRQMMASNPDLDEDYQRDPKLFNQMFSTLRTFQPAFTRDPLVAGNYMRQMAGSPLTAGGVAVQAIGAGKDIKRPMREAFFGGARQTG
jgi:hypothetical protein